MPTTSTTTTTTTTTTTVPPAPSWPEELGSSDLLDAYAIATDRPLVRVTVAQSTSQLLADGTTDEGEGIDITETWSGDRVEGHADFRGLATITAARASGNAALAEIMLTDGIDYILDGASLYLPRRVAATLHPDITSSGSEWVSIEVALLEATEVFVAGLLAPFQSARLRPIEEEVETTSELTFTTENRATYNAETATVTQTVELDPEGALRAIRIRAAFLLGPIPAVQTLEITYDPLETDLVEMMPTDAADITAEFKAYVAERESAVFLNSDE